MLVRRVLQRLAMSSTRASLPLRRVARASTAQNPRSVLRARGQPVRAWSSAPRAAARAPVSLVRAASWVLGTVTASAALWSTVSEAPVRCDKKWPEYTRAQVAAHATPETGIWVTYKDGVYDITEFVEAHPGGRDRIMLAAGGAIDPFWRLYQQHGTDAVQHILKGLQIGVLAPGEYDEAKEAADDNDPYAHEPERHPALRVHKQKPFNAEVPSALLVNSFITPNELFYVRHHHPVPVVDPAAYRLVMKVAESPATDGCPAVYRTVEFTLDQLKAFPQTSVTTTIQCAGNRRVDYTSVDDVQGLPWDIGAISTATWTGVRLRDVLAVLGVTDARVVDAANADSQHVHLVAVDVPYDASIPLEKAVSPTGDCLLAFEMNGVPLPPEHGFPVRAIVPGVAGARNVKWVDTIVVAHEESYSNWQRGVPYKGFSSNVRDFAQVDPSRVLSVQELPVQSAIARPAQGDAVHADEETVTVKGFAWSGGGRGIVRVDVSPDGGNTWLTATLGEGAEQPPSRAWAWTLWEVEVPIQEDAVACGEMELVCKAVDASYNVQPESVKGIWNLRGILNNAWHRVHIRVDTDDDDDA